ncbi:achelase-1-like [Centruroides sculpturatus]|uniref:achelase-1-like n=1 Tax=Centruroides sculpturatus TaxID=218467 RepID=UPI000C6DE809|nr:achelase-1-like [Centruroides sculpturatus]
MKDILRFGLLFFLLNVIYTLSVHEKNETKSGRQRRIVGGEIANDGEFPYMVAIFRKNSCCGGFTLITTQTVLGSAHPIEGVDIRDLSGRVGNVNKFKGHKILFDRKILHPSYNGTRFLHDIAILLLNCPIQNLLNVQPTALAGINQRFTSGNAIVIGWGRTGPGEEHRNAFLRWAEVNLVDPKDGWITNPRYKITGKEIMTVTPGVASMRGDSGSPLIIKDNSGQHVVIGVSSGGHNAVNKADVYMSTSVYHDFIANNSRGVLVYHVLI